MSNQLPEVVPIFDGSSYPRWADLMQAYLQHSNHSEVMTWAQAESKAQGSICLHLNAEVTKTIKSKTMAKALWEALKETYGIASPMAVFNYFKAAVTAQIPANQHPGASIAKNQGNLDRLQAARLNVPANLRALIILGAAPARYETAIQICLNEYELADLRAGNAHEAIVASWESTSKRSQQSTSGNAQVGKDPNFSTQQQQQQQQQQRSSEQQQKQQQKKKQWGKHASKGGKKCNDDHSHTHLASAATTIAVTPLTVDPCALLRKLVIVNGPESESKYSTLKHMFSLASDLDVTPSFECLRTLEDVVRNVDKGEGSSRIVEINDTDSESSSSSKRCRLSLAQQMDIDWTNREPDNVGDAIDHFLADEETSDKLTADPYSDVDDELAQAAGLDEQYYEQTSGGN
ncbi:hypothetical protein OH77DRAFT_1430296 [Trametes cingulata]|nr:hypothetical protein OH77DRAFT_1430296 [Trametes cingulata]